MQFDSHKLDNILNMVRKIADVIIWCSYHRIILKFLDSHQDANIASGSCRVFCGLSEKRKKWGFQTYEK